MFNPLQRIRTCGAFAGVSCCDGDGGSDDVILYLETSVCKLFLVFDLSAADAEQEVKLVLWI